MIILVLILGACVGSFCESFASRFVLKKALFSSRSYCFFCERKLGILELVPIFSFILLKAKCKTCKKALPYSLLFSEILGSMLCLVAFLVSESFKDFLLLFLFLSNLFLLSLIDLRLKAVPKSLLLSAFFLAFLLAFKKDEILHFMLFMEFKDGFLINSFLFAGFIFLLKSFVSFFANIKRKEVLENLGDADLIIISCIGGITGLTNGFLTLFVACVLSLPFFIFSRQKELAFIPFLSLAFVLVLLFKEFYEA